MASETNSSPTVTSQSAGGGTQAWTNPTNAEVEDGTNATNAFGFVTGTTEHLRALFTMTSVSGPIDGIVASAKIARAGGVFHDGVIRLWHGGSMVGADKSRGAGTNWANLTPAWVDWGGSTDMWSTTLTDANVTDGTFGFSIQGIKPNAAASSGGLCDAMAITVYYTAPVGSDRAPFRGVMRGVLRAVRVAQGWLGVPPDRRWRQQVAHGVLRQVQIIEVA